MNFDENNPFLKNLREIEELTKAAEMQQSNQQFEDLLAQQEKKLEAESQLPVQEVYLDDYPQQPATNDLNYGKSEIEKKAKEQYPELAAPLIETEDLTNNEAKEIPRQDQSTEESGELSNLNSQIPFSSENDRGMQEDFSADYRAQTKESPLDYIRRKYNISTPDRSEELANLQKKTRILEAASDIDKAFGQLGSWKTVLAKKMGYDVPGYKGGGLADIAAREKQEFDERTKLEDQQRKKMAQDLGIGKAMIEFENMVKNNEELDNPNGKLANLINEASRSIGFPLREGTTPREALQANPDLVKLAMERKFKEEDVINQRKLKELEAEQELTRDERKFQQEAKLKQMELEKKKTEPKKGVEEVDKEFAKKYANWITETGTISPEKSISNLKAAISELENSEITGGIAGKAYAATPEGLRASLYPDIARIETNLQSAVVDTLRPLLGGQFAAEEGARIMRQTFDAAQPVSENVRRAKLVLNDQIRKLRSRERAVKYWEKHKTLANYEAFPEDNELQGSEETRGESSGITPSVRDRAAAELERRKAKNRGVKE